jgi:hypothetical protein
MTALSPFMSIFSGAALLVVIIALAVLILIWRLALRAEYQKASFFCRLFGFSIETRMKTRR